jgi:FKBP-type peptidyl-prolyl cis-trans isomerase SlyD
MRFSIHAISDNGVTVDLNHPLAGKDLHFDVEVVEVRPATEADMVSHVCADGSCGSCDEHS